MWPPDLLLPSDTVLCYCLGELTTTNLPLLVAESVSHQAKHLHTQYFELSYSGRKKLDGMAKKELDILIRLLMVACASYASDGVIRVVCIKLVNYALERMIGIPQSI